MAMNDQYGCSLCKVGEERFEKYNSSVGGVMVQYDYRHTDGELFSCVAKTLEECRTKRDKWLYGRS